jgi:hypothetical protein
MDDLQYSSKVYESNTLNPHVHHNQPSPDKDDHQPEQSNRGSGSKSADCINSRHFEREFALPLFESYIAHNPETPEDQESGLETMVRSLAGEETQKWFELVYARAGDGSTSADRVRPSHHQSGDNLQRNPGMAHRAVSFTTTHQEALEVDEELGLVDPETSSEMTVEDVALPRRRR